VAFGVDPSDRIGRANKARSRRPARNRPAMAAGLATLALFVAAHLLLPEEWRETFRETALDMVLAIDHRLEPKVLDKAAANLIVVDVDRRSLAEIGAWPWPRERMADLVTVIASAKPAVVAFDMLFSEPDERSPAALARRLAGMMGRADLGSLADTLPDGDNRLAEAFASVPVALGFVLDPEQSGSVPSVPMLLRGPLPLHRLWRGAGAVGPVPTLAAAAAGIGTLSLPANADGVVRRAPLLVGAGEALLPGLALETVRLLRAASAYVLRSEPATLEVGDVSLPVPPDALLRLLPVGPHRHAARTISAADLLRDKSDGGRLTGAVVVVGGSAPELGGLRQTPDDPLTPDAQIQADAIAQILAGRIPRAFNAETVVSIALIGGFGMLALVAAAGLAPLRGFATVALALLLLWATAVGLLVFADRLLDPLTPSLAATVIFGTTTVSSYAATYRREARVRRSFEQRLAPAVVRRLVEEPGLLKLSGERRELTALFTDVEGFTAMTHRADPEQLVAVLDDYFEGAAAIVVEHGGMIDKIVGDAIHALFNAPLDLADHPRRAIDCAVALRTWTALFRRRPGPQSIGFGRTRIGIESGEMIVGDVGSRAKLDYTAYGDAINVAARLEAANKQLGSTICIGPAAAAQCAPDLLRPLGTIEVRGRDEKIDVFEPWLDDAPQSWRERYLAAFRSIDEDPVRAAALFQRLAAEREDDPVPRILADRLRCGV
jgi:adenylate cyclase